VFVAKKGFILSGIYLQDEISVTCTLSLWELFRARIHRYYHCNDSKVLADRYWGVANSRSVEFYVNTRKAVINIHPPLFPFAL
jgi:hypothetical protein